MPVAVLPAITLFLIGKRHPVCVTQSSVPEQDVVTFKDPDAFKFWQHLKDFDTSRLTLIHWRFVAFRVDVSGMITECASAAPNQLTFSSLNVSPQKVNLCG